MKKHKLFIAMVLGCSLLIPNCAFADSVVNSETEVLENTIEPHAHDWEYKRIVKNRKLHPEVYIGLATGQNATGTVFKTKGGFSYTETGGDALDVTVSVSYGPISVSVDPGTVEKAGGVNMESPYIGKACWLHVWKDLEVIEYDLFRKMAGTSQEWQKYGTETKVLTGKVYYGVYDVMSEPKDTP